MLKRAKISVTRRKSKTIIFFLFLLIVANLVLSSISIKNATEESMKMARVSLGSEVILQTDMEKIRDEFMNNKDNEQSTDENKKDDMKNMHNAMDESTATINDVNKLKEMYDINYYEIKPNKDFTNLSFTPKNDIERIIRIIPIKDNDKFKSNKLELGIITINLSNIRSSDGTQLYKNIFKTSKLPT